MLEREAELDHLRQVIDDAVHGRGRMVVIEGPPGIGKTTLLTAAGRCAAEAGMQRLTARGSQLEQAFAFGLMLQLLAPVIRGADDEQRGQLFSGAAGLVRRLFDTGESTGAPGADQEFAVLHGLYWLVAGIAERTPVLLTVDDVQWADRASLRALSFLSRRFEGLQAAILLAMRPVRSLELREATVELVTDPNDVVHPSPLSRDAVATLLRGDTSNADGVLIDSLHRATRGNPFYLRAALDELREGGAVSPSRVETLSPRAISSALLRRLSVLPPAAAQAVRGIAVLGDGVAAHDVAALTGIDELSEEVVLGLVHADILREDDGLSFAHPIARSTVYADMGSRERARLHTKAAKQLITAGARTERIAVQLMRATPGTVPQAVQVLRTAANSATEHGAADIAAVHLRRALEEPLDDELRAALTAELGHASAVAGLPEAESELRTAMDLATSVERQAEVGRDLARLLSVMGRGEEAIDVLVDRAGQCPPSRPELRKRLQVEALSVGDMDLAVHSYAAAKAGTLGPVDRAAVDPTTASMLWAHDATDAIMRCVHASEAVEAARRALSSAGLLAAGLAGVQLSFLAGYALACADLFDEAERFFDDVLAAARQMGSAAGYASASGWLGSVAHRRGDLRAALAHSRAGLDTARSVGLRLVENTALIVTCYALIDADEVDDAAAELGQATFDANDIGSFLFATRLDARGRVRLAQGQYRAGVEDLLRAGRRLAGVGLDNPSAFPWRSAAAPGLVALKEHAQARTLIREETALARRWGAPRALAVALRAEAAAASGEQGIELLREAVDVLGESAAHLVRAQVLIDLGAALRRSGHARDARPHLREGLQFAHVCGAPTEAARARAELRAAGGRPRTPLRTGIDALTPSEHRVARLAAEGRSNPEIAQDLFVTVKTVEMHLSGVYRKLDIRSRAELPDVLSGG